MPKAGADSWCIVSLFYNWMIVHMTPDIPWWALYVQQFLLQCEAMFSWHNSNICWCWICTSLTGLVVTCLTDCDGLLHSLCHDHVTIAFCLWDLLWITCWNTNYKLLLTTRKPSWHKGYARQRCHSKMAVSRHLEYYRTGNSTIRSADPENPSLEPDMEWIRCTVCEIFAFELYCDLETGVRGHSRSLKVAPLDRPTLKTPH